MLEKHLFIRVLIAATDFEPGDFIFREKELVVSLNIRIVDIIPLKGKSDRAQVVPVLR